MSTKQNDNNSPKKNNKTKKLVNDKSVTSIVSEDKNKIADATSEAKKNIDSVAYADNLIPPNENSKSIRSLNIENKINEVLEEDNSENEIELLEETNQIGEEKNESIEPEEQIDEKKDEQLETQEKIKEIDNIVLEENKEISKKSHKTLLIVSISILAIALLFFIFSTIFALINGNKNTIINGIKIKDIDVSGLTKEQATQKLTSAFEGNNEKQITLQYNNYEVTVFPSQFDVSFAIEDAVNIAYEKGRMRKYFSK